MGHAKHSPSGAQGGWGACPARLEIPGLPAGQAAEDGTRCHVLALDVWLTRYMQGEEPYWPASFDDDPDGEDRA